MLSLQRFHLLLRRVTAEDLEEIRLGRNADFVRRNHLFREEITPQMQQQWFESIQHQSQYYFVITKRGSRIGLVHISDIAPDLSVANYGLFIWDSAYRSSPVPVLTTLLILDFFFIDIGIEKISGRVLAGNEPIIRICRFFDFALDPVPGKEYLLTWSTRERYLEKRAGLLAFAAKFIHDETELALRVSGVPSGLHLPQVNALLK